MWESDLEPVLERVRRATQEALQHADLGSWGASYEALHRGSLILSSVFEDDSNGPDDPLEAVLRSYIRAEAYIHSRATSAEGLRSVEKTLQQEAGGTGVGGVSEVWWVHDGVLPNRCARETGLWLAARSWGSQQTKDRIGRGRWTNGETVKAVLLIRGPRWIHQWLMSATVATGSAVEETDPDVSWYIPHLWRDDRGHRYFDLRNVHKAAEKLSRASKRPSGLNQAEPSVRVDSEPQRPTGDASGNVLEDLGAP